MPQGGGPATPHTHGAGAAFSSTGSSPTINLTGGGLDIDTASQVSQNGEQLFTFNGQEILLSQVDEYLRNLYSNGYVETLTEYETAIEYMIQEKVWEDQIEKQQLNQFTAEEEEALRADAEKEWEDALFQAFGGGAAFRKPQFKVWIGYDF